MKLLPLSSALFLAFSPLDLLAQNETAPAPTSTPGAPAATASLAGPEAITISVYQLGFTGPAYLGNTGIMGALMLTSEQTEAIMALWERLLSESVVETGDSNNRRLGQEQGQLWRAELQTLLTPEQFDIITAVNAATRDYLAELPPDTHVHSVFLKLENREDYQSRLEGTLTPEQMENVRLFAR